PGCAVDSPQTSTCVPVQTIDPRFVRNCWGRSGSGCQSWSPGDQRQPRSAKAPSGGEMPEPGTLSHTITSSPDQIAYGARPAKGGAGTSVHSSTPGSYRAAAG